MRVLATYSIKGGVGKTAAAVNLSYAAARAGFPTLVWDLDPQAAATFSFRIKPKVKGGAKAVIRGSRPLDGAIRGTDFEGLDLVPADFSYRHLDLLLDERKRPTRRVRRLLKPLRDDYEAVFLDCPPSISLSTEAVIEAADVLLVPLIPTVLSVRTLDQLASFVEKRGADVQVLPFFSMVDRRRKQHREVLESLPRQYPGILETAVPYSSAVERVSVERAPLWEFARRSRPADAFAELWAEVVDRVWGGPSLEAAG